MSDITEKTVLITGASSGIGKAAAKLFAAEGAHVVLAARSQDSIENIASEIEDAGARALAVKCDVADYSAVKACVDETVKAFGSLDILINNAGVVDPIARLADSEPEGWGNALDTNVKGVYHGLRAAIPVMQAQGAGTVINLSSGAATSALEGWSHYCASKAAVLMLTRVADLEYREKGITVLGYSPGTVATQMQVQIKASGINPVSRMEVTDHYPPEMPAKALVYLSGPAGKNWAGTDCSHKDAGFRKIMGWD